MGEKLKNWKSLERDRTVDRSTFQRVPLLSIWQQASNEFCGHGIPSDSIEFSRKRLAFSDCANVIILKFPSGFIALGSVLIRRVLLRFSRSLRAIPATLRHSGDDLVHARSSGKRLIIIRRSSIERCLAASLSRCDRFGPIDSSLVPIPAHLRIILLSDDFAIGCFHRPRHGISFLFFFFECRTSNRLTYFDRSCMFELRVCKSI